MTISTPSNCIRSRWTKLAYPPIAISVCVQGTVAVVVEIGKTGEVVNTDIVHGHAVLRYVADEATRRWTFPSDDSGLRRRQVVTYTFVLTDGEPSPRILMKSPSWVEVRASGRVIHTNADGIDVVATRERNAKCLGIR